jgi:hypothetical protein
VPCAVVTTLSLPMSVPSSTTSYVVIWLPSLSYTAIVYVVPAAPLSSIRAAPFKNVTSLAVPAASAYAGSES